MRLPIIPTSSDIITNMCLSEGYQIAPENTSAKLSPGCRYSVMAMQLDTPTLKVEICPNHSVKPNSIWTSACHATYGLHMALWLCLDTRSVWVSWWGSDHCGRSDEKLRAYDAGGVMRMTLIESLEIVSICHPMNKKSPFQSTGATKS